MRFTQNRAEQLSRKFSKLIGIRWGKGGLDAHIFSGIKAARVIESLQKNYGLDVATIHGFGFR